MFHHGKAQIPCIRNASDLLLEWVPRTTKHKYKHEDLPEGEDIRESVVAVDGCAFHICGFYWDKENPKSWGVPAGNPKSSKSLGNFSFETHGFGDPPV